MWKGRILESLDAMGLRYYAEGARGEFARWHDYLPYAVEFRVDGLLPAAMSRYPIEESFYHMDRDGSVRAAARKIAGCRLPYPVTLLTGCTDYTTQRNYKHEIVVLMVEEEGFVHIDYMFRNREGRFYIGDVMEVPPISLRIDRAHGGVCCDIISGGIGVERMGYILEKYAGRGIQLLDDYRWPRVCTEIIQAAYFLELLSCKNILTQVVEVDEALNRSRAKKGKHPLYEYRILNVDVSRQSEKTECRWGEPQYHQRLHFNRGHFKEYTAEKPLFGRHVGTYWWQPHLSGQDKEHFLNKDYTVK